MKKTKFAMLLVMVLVFVLQSVGMMHAEAEDATPAISVENLSVDYIFGGLGEALTYGVVADEFYQMTHAETSVCVETLYKYADQPFMNTDKTYTVSQMRPIKASVSVRPTEGQTLNGTKYALFTVNGDKLEMCEGTVVEVNEDVDVTVLTWELEKDSPYRWENLCVRQVRGAANEIVEEGAVVMPGGLTVTYGPDISSAAPSSSYVGNIVSDKVRDTIKFHNTIDSDQPIELGSTRLVVETRLNEMNANGFGYKTTKKWRDITSGALELAYDQRPGEMWPRTYEELVSTDVYVEYTVLNDVDSEGNPVIHRAKYSAFVEDGGAFELKYERDDATGKVSFYFEQDGKKYYHTFTSTTGKATKLLQQATEFSKELAQLQGGQSLTNDINADPSLFGNSTVASGLDANNRVVSVYSATITNGLIDFDASSEVLDKQIHIAPNEYVIVNVICDPDAESVTVGGPGVAPPYIYAAGKQEQATWPGEPGSDTGSPDRVLYNFVTLGDDGKYKPYTGKIQTETQYYGGTFLAPEADIVTGNAVINGALIAKSVKNPQNELHQRTMLQAAQTTWVKMAGRRANGNGAIYLKKFDATTEQLLNDAVFGLFTDEAAAKAATMESIDDQTKIGTTVDGEFTFNNLTPGTYYVKELKAPAGYVLNNAVFTVEVQANGIAVVGLEFGGVPNNSENGVGWLSIDKVDATNNNKKIANAVFEVYACEGDTFDADKAVLADTITTDANGNAQSKLLNAGTYWVKETNTAFGYLPQEAPVKVIITKEKVTYVGNSAGSEDKVSFTNEEAPTGTLSFVKQDADYPDTKLSGAKFAIYAESDVDLAKPLKTFETQRETGKVEEKLPVGTYWIAEIQAPQNYTITFEPQLITITEGETTQIGTDGVVTNDYMKVTAKVGKVELIREWAGYEFRDVPYALAGAWFGVYRDAECKDLVSMQKTGKDGYASFEVRPNETFYLKELAAPNGYVLSDAPVLQFQVYAHEDGKTIPYNSPYGYNHWAYPQWNGALINAKAEETGALKLYKNTWDLDPDGLPADGTDNRDNVVAIKGAVFGIYFDEKCEMPIEGSPFTTGEDGGIVVSGLTPGKYWVKELEAAPGYLLNDDLLWVEVKAGDTDARVHWQDANGNDYRWIYNAVAEKPAEVQVEIEKTVDTEYLLPDDAEYTFEMEYVSGPTTGYQFVGGENTTTVDFRGKDGDTQKTHGPGASFSPIKIKFTEAGTYVFTVSEASNVVAGELTSMKYDPEVYTITYQVNTDTDGNLKLEPKAGTVKKSDGTTNYGALAFENAYKTVDITCSKVWQDGDDDRLRIDAGTFKSDYLELYVLKQDKDGQIVKDEKNKEVLIPVTNADLTAWNASFTIASETGEAERFRWYYHGLPGFDEYGNDALYVIKELTVTGYQTFYFNAGDSNSYRPDATDAIYPKTGPNATNNTIYNTLSKSTLTINKTVKVDGTTDTPEVDEFQFTITPATGLTGYHFVDAEGKELASPVTVAVEKNADGTISGALPVTILFDNFTKAEKKFTFTVAEVKPDPIPAGWTYDATEQTVTFTVTRNANDYTVTVSPDEAEADFTNAYKKTFEGSISFYVNKELDGKSSTVPFSFELLRRMEDEKLEQLAVQENSTISDDPNANLPAGVAAFKLAYDDEDLGKTYEYVIRELKKDGYTHDTAEYKYKVAISKAGEITRYYWDSETADYEEGNSHALFSNKTLTSVTVYKCWPNSEPQDVSAYLYLCTLDADGTLTKLDPQPTESKTDNDGSQTYIWSDLPKFDAAGNEITYAVIEEGMEGYFPEYPEGQNYAKNEETITNNVARGDFYIYKEVSDTNEIDMALLSFDFTITPGAADGFTLSAHMPDEPEDNLLTLDEDGLYTIALGADKQMNFDVVFTKAGTYTFTVKEKFDENEIPDGWVYDDHTYSVTFVVGKDGSVVKSEKDDYDCFFTNEYYGTTGLTVCKEWVGAAASDIPVKPKDFGKFLTLRYAEYPLDAEGNPNYAYEDFTEADWTVYKGEYGFEATVDEDTLWYVAYADLPNAIDGKIVTWSVVEDPIDGFTTKYTDDKQWAEDWDAITNSRMLTSASINKSWLNESFESADKVPNIADKLTLCKLVEGEPVPVNDAPKPAYEAMDERGGCYNWSELPKYDENGKEIEYVVVEQKMDGYEQTYFDRYGGTIENGTYAPNGGGINNAKVEEVIETTNVSINKFWVNENFESVDKVPNIADKLALCKLVEGEPVPVNDAPKPAYEAMGERGGCYNWSELPKYDENGKEIEYVVVEQKMDGYEQTYFDRYGDTIENGTYAPDGGGIDNAKVEEEIETTNVSITKVWVGGPLVDSDISDNLMLFADGVAQTDKPTKTDNVYSWYDLPKYDGNDELISYSVKEDDVADGYTVTYQDENGEDAGDAAFDGGMITNTYEEKIYESKGEIAFDGIKIFDGHTMEGGEFTFILTDKSGKELQRVTNAEDGTFAFAPIKYTEKDVPYGTDAEFTYYITELEGNLPGVTYDDAKYEITVGLWDDTDGTIHVGDISDSADGIIFTNTYKAEGSVTFQGAKFLLGREFKAGDEFTFELLNDKGDVIDTVTINPTSGTKADFAFETIKYDLDDAGKNYTYTYRVKEKAGTEDGMTYDDTVHTVTVTVSDAGDGTLEVVASDAAKHLNFTNTYLAEGSVIFSGNKTMEGKELAGDDFTFVLTDADGKVIETVTNDEDGKIVFSTIEYELEDAGKTFTYKVSEKNDGKKAVTYDDTVYTVTVKVEDAGSGHLTVTASDNATKLNFKNSYEAKAVLTMNAYKTVNGYKPSVGQVYDFVLQGDDGTEMKAQNKAETITFGTIAFDEEDIGKTFIYTVKETTEANELLDVDAAIYQVKVTVADNGDGNLKLETEILKDGKRANGVVFANTATATLAISKNVKGPGPDKAFDLKVTFIGVDGKELEGVYDYDGDVKGTITSGGVIALKDGQSVTIVGLPEGATYTVEENAGPAYTVTVNGKPIAKAEGTLVGHGKLEFINTVEVTTFSATKVWEGTDLGEITLTLYADGKQITPQPEVTREGNKYTYYNLPKYNEEGEEIVYSAKERGIDGYIRIYKNVEPYQNVTSFVHDGGTIINRETHEEVHELSFKIHKVWTGVEATEEIPAITLTLYCNGEKLDVPTPKPDGEGWYRYYDLPKSVNGKIAVYTVIEEPIAGYTVTYKTASGEIVEEGVNGGEIVNAKIPQTGDHATLGLWLALMGASAVLLTMLQRRRKA